MSREFLGRGGFGHVEKVTLPDGKIIARKTLDLRGDESDQNRIRRFQREVTYQSRFNNKNIVPILHHNLDASPPFFDMPLATCDLVHELENRSTLNINSKSYAFLCALSGIEHIHMRQQLHRDIKPENILRFDAPDGSYIYKLSDFGLISQSPGRATTNITGVGSGFGTEEFLAREVFKNGFQAASVQSDIYSLGVLLFHLFASEQERHESYPYTPRQTSHPMKAVIAKCTANNPLDRYSTVALLRSDFISFSARLMGVK